MDEVLVYVRPKYRNSDNTYDYEFFFSSTPDFVWGPDWDIDNPSISGDLTPEESTYNKIYTAHTDIPIKTVEETSCYSMEYATYGILALAWLDIDGLEAYPEHGRMTLHFGDSLNFVKMKLAEYNWSLVENDK